LGKNDRFDLLGWLNECWDPFLIVITLMWTSRQLKVPIICSWLFSEGVFPLFSMMKHFSLKTEWFDVGDCATMTVVAVCTVNPDWKMWQLSTRYLAWEGEFQACDMWKNFCARCSCVTAFNWNHNGAWNLFSQNLLWLKTFIRGF